MLSSNKLLIAGIAAGTAIFGGLAYLYRCNVFTSAVVVPAQIPKCKLFFTKFIGNYNKIGPVFNKVEQKAKELNIPRNQQILVGIYLDNPTAEGQDPNKCRAIVGVMVDSVDEQILKSYAQGEDKNFILADLKESREGVQCQFQVKNILGMLVAIKKAYPALEEYAQENSKNDLFRVSVEICDPRNPKANYRIIIPFDNADQYIDLY